MQNRPTSKKKSEVIKESAVRKFLPQYIKEQGLKQNAEVLFTSCKTAIVIVSKQKNDQIVSIIISGEIWRPAIPCKGVFSKRNDTESNILTAMVFNPTWSKADGADVFVERYAEKSSQIQNKATDIDKAKYNQGSLKLITV